RGGAEPRREARGGPAPALRALGEPLHGPARARPLQGAAAARPRAARALPAGLRLRVRGPAPRARADGEHRGGYGLEHGGRHADPPAGQAPAEPLRVLPAAVRAGHQPADRLAARDHGDVAPDAPRPPRVAAARAAQLRPHAPDRAPDLA